MKPATGFTRLATPLFVATLAACGGGGLSSTCTPPPLITCVAATAADAGGQYRYVVDARYVCGFFVCANVDAIELPTGADLQGPVPQTISWTPSAIQANTDPTFEIATPADFCGKRARQTWRVHVAPDTTAPAVREVWPRDTESNVAIGTGITAAFSEPVDPASISPASFLFSGPAGPVAGSISIFPDSATFTPAVNLPASSVISVSLTMSIKDLAGNPLTTAHVWVFTTGAAPAVAPAG